MSWQCLLGCRVVLTTRNYRKHGGTDNGKPGVRKEMSRQPYYAAFVIDPAGNNLETVRVDKTGVRNSTDRSH